MTLHLEEGLDLADGQVLAVSKRHQLIEGAEKLVGILQNLSLVEALACAGHNLSEQVQGIDVLEDIGLTVGNEYHVKLVQRLIDEAHIVLFDGRVLGTAVGELREGREEGFNAGSWHLPELAGEDSFPAAGANRSCEDDLEELACRYGKCCSRKVLLTILAEYGDRCRTNWRCRWTVATRLQGPRRRRDHTGSLNIEVGIVNLASARTTRPYVQQLALLHKE